MKKNLHNLFCMIVMLKPLFSWKVYLFVIISGGLAFLPNIQLIVTERIGNALPSSIQQGQFGELIVLLVVQAGIFALIQIFIAGNRMIEKQLNSQFKCYLQEVVHKKMSKVKISLLERADVHNQMMTLSSTLPSLGFPLLMNLFNLAKSVLSISVMLYVMRNIHGSVLIIIAAVSFLNVFIVRKYYHRQLQIYVQASEDSRKAEYLSGLLTDRELASEVRMFQLNQFIISRWKTLFISVEKLQVQFKNKQELLYGSLQILTQVLQLVMLVILVLFTSFTIGTYLLVTQGLLHLQNTAHELVESFNRLQETSIYLPSFFKVLQLDEEAEEPHLIQFQGLNHEIKIQNMSFKYPNSERNVLQQIDMTIHVGEKVAIVGHNGSGKTTLVKCLLGLYDHYEGEIVIDGVSLQNYDKNSLREHIAVLLQNYGKYPMSVQENIWLSEEGDGDNNQQLWDAIRLSDSQDFINALPDFMETQLNPTFSDGVDLSGGQWQKIGLARAYYKNADIVILDEPTAAIDPLAEDRLFQGMLTHLLNKTAIILTHRLGICRWVDKIIVMDGGRVVEIGSHDKLMEEGTYYKEMYDSQLKWYVNCKAAK
ncbi:ABC transporter ATP-binding protein/permease [Paenibacillus sp. N3/727]|uniref:ABC transporter ATP-binding protein n=1 Tax=Paenibacillus sp. N3/727 TaxID=2925845 RepID=UPI001F531D23|nr:ABC transporter ATP-binding protein [Paenibacillus sp. N3/727]UNK20359.1 ABC transporter ATP-binding protein/permease [Paenibacillus sp. N3/727]